MWCFNICIQFVQIKQGNQHFALCDITLWLEANTTSFLQMDKNDHLGQICFFSSLVIPLWGESVLFSNFTIRFLISFSTRRTRKRTEILTELLLDECVKPGDHHCTTEPWSKTAEMLLNIPQRWWPLKTTPTPTTHKHS